MAFRDVIEEVQVLGKDLVHKVKSLLHEGNVQRLIIKKEQGITFIEIPITFAAIGMMAAPVLAAVGAMAALAAKFTIGVQRSGPREDPPTGV